jgi:hypothetical protein
MLLLAIFGLVVGLWARGVLLDDAMITFRVAENLAYGRGFVYNLGEYVQVTTTPLYTMSLVPGIWLFGSAPAAALILNLSLAALIPALAYDVGRRLSGRITGLGAALMLPIAPLLVIAFSMESYLYVALILATLDAYAAGRWRLAGVLAGLTALVRGDAVLLGACLLTYDLVASRRLRWRLIIPAMAIPALWYLFATFYYGSPFPATLSAKTAQGEFNWLGKRFADGFWGYWKSWIKENFDSFYLFPWLIGLALLWAIWREQRWLILAAHDVLYITAFVLLGVPAAEWYYAPLMPGAALLAARGVQAVAELVAWPVGAAQRRHSQPDKVLLSILHAGVAALLLVILAATLYPNSARLIGQHPNWKAQIYPETARWIAQNTNSAASMATIDIGHLGYWSGRRIIDIVGLAQPDVAPHIVQGDFGYAIRHYRPDLVLLGYSWLPEVQTTAWFQAEYVARHYFYFKTMDIPLVLFSRRSGVKVQPDPLPPPTEIKALEVDFNRQIRLIGYHLNQPLLPGGQANVTLYWQVQAPITVDFTVFVQVVDSTNNILAQGDGKPQSGFYTTPYWQPGEEIIDLHSITIPADLPAGPYDILLGFYEAESGNRLQILDEAGQFKADHVRLSNIQVQMP